MILFPEPKSMVLTGGEYEFPMREEYGELTGFFRLVRDGGIPEIRTVHDPKRRSTGLPSAKTARRWKAPARRACSAP